VYELDRLRCNLCGEVFTAQEPEGIGPKKYDETTAAMIALHHEWSHDSRRSRSGSYTQLRMTLCLKMKSTHPRTGPYTERHTGPASISGLPAASSTCA
jgi:hypothetical protein